MRVFPEASESARRRKSFSFLGGHGETKACCASKEAYCVIYTSMLSMNHQTC